MSIGNHSRDQFAKILNSMLSARSPIRSIERLLGRTKEVRLVEEALYDEGGHVFIYGERGVGKSSLAASVAAQYQSSDNVPIQIPCGKDTKFYNTIEELAERVLRESGGEREYKVDHTLDFKIYKVNIKKNCKEITIPKIDSMFAAVDL